MLLAVLYNLALLLASPLLALYLVHRLGVKGKSRDGLVERLGWAPLRPRKPPGGRIWLHAVSAGEVVAAAAIVRRLAELGPETEVVISTTTPAGQQQARKLVPGAAAHFYFPFDFLPCVLLALHRARPDVIAAVETELWPNWLWLARMLGMRTAVVNGQFADKGYRGARRFRWFYWWVLSNVEVFLMQTARAAERALFLGADPARVRVAGNVKFEQSVPSLRPEVSEVVRRALGLEELASAPAATGVRGSGRPLFLAGSTHPGEEEQVLDAFRVARERQPDLALLLAPRHVERAPEILTRVQGEGWRAALRSTAPAGPLDVLVLDTMGELAGLYALADVVFVGGSLVPIGGHDILQPIFQERPTLFGPHMHNQHDLARLALEEGAAIQVSSPRELGEQVARLSSDPVHRQELREAGARLLQRNAGAARESARLLVRLLRGEAVSGPAAVEGRAQREGSA